MLKHVQSVHKILCFFSEISKYAGLLPFSVIHFSPLAAIRCQCWRYYILLFREQRENYGFIVPSEKTVQRKRTRNGEMKTVPSNIFKGWNFKPKPIGDEIEVKIPKKDCKTQMSRYPQKAAWLLRKIPIKVAARKVQFKNCSKITNKSVYYIR